MPALVANERVPKGMGIKTSAFRRGCFTGTAPGARLKRDAPPESDEGIDTSSIRQGSRTGQACRRSFEAR